MPASAASASSNSRWPAFRCSSGTMAIIMLFGRAAPAAAERRDDARRFQPPRQDAGRAVWPRERHLPDCACAKAPPIVGKHAAAIDLPTFPASSSWPSRTGRRRAAAPGTRSPRATTCSCAATPSRRPISPRRCTSPSATSAPRAGRGDAVQPPLRPCRSRRPAALGADRTDRVSRHGDGKRRPDRPCRAARGQQIVRCRRG